MNTCFGYYKINYKKVVNKMKVIKKDGTKKNYILTLKMLGYPNGYKWHYVEYDNIIIALEKIYPELKNNIDRAYL